MNSWNDCYERELNNYSENAEDEGTVWFSDSGAEEKVVNYLIDLAQAEVLRQGDSETKEIDASATSFLDLGTGNGHLLFSLREEGFSGYMLGVDYSLASVKLATQIEETRQAKDSLEGSFAPVEFQELDILSPSNIDPRQFDVVLDKGTFDAISLSPEKDSLGRRMTERYRAHVKPFIKEGGIFVITSCNWTEEELRKWLEVEERANGSLVYKNRIKYSTFRFQGQQGQSVVTLCFQKVDDR